MILKERAIRAKAMNRDVVVIGLGSCDGFGKLLKVPLVYDLVTKREMGKNGITFHNAVELGQMFHGVTYNLAEGDNRQLVMDMVGKIPRGEITYPQMYEILDGAGIDRNNAVAYYNANKNKNAGPFTIDVYDGLIEYVKRNRQKDIFVDEFPVLMNSKSKIELFQEIISGPCSFIQQLV